VCVSHGISLKVIISVAECVLCGDDTFLWLTDFYKAAYDRLVIRSLCKMHWQNYHVFKCISRVLAVAYEGLVKTITGSTKITYHAEGPEGEAWEADFTPPFKKLDLIKGLEAELNVKLPDAATLHTEGKLC